MSKKQEKFYITTTLPYVNASPHIGFALEIVQADVIARYQRLSGKNVFFNFGTDEHGQKIYQKAVEQKKDPQEYVDEYAKKFDDLKKALNLSYNAFIRTTVEKHIKAAQKIWELCAENGFIEKGIYRAKYCVGCELEKTDSELEDGKCPYHPTYELELIEEENYFFKFSKFQDKLLKLYKDNPKFVIPDFRQKEIENFVKEGLQDFSISRLKEKMPWGIDVPGDDKHVMYVWFDALTNYISTIDWPQDRKKFTEFWGTKENPNAIQVAGKDNLRQQSAMWQAMLMAADLPATKQILIHGFIESGGQKMSKSIGNVIDPYEVIEKYGTEATRYFLLAKIHPFDDSDFTYERFEESYTADLANGVGNFVSRVVGLVDKFTYGKVPEVKKDFDEHPLRVDNSIHNWKKTWKDIDGAFVTYRLDRAMSSILEFISAADKYIDETKPWVLAKEDKREELNWVIYGLCDAVHQLSWQLLAFLPETAIKIANTFQIEGVLKTKPDYKHSWTNIKPGTKVSLEESLFPRLN